MLGPVTRPPQIFPTRATGIFQAGLPACWRTDDCLWQEASFEVRMTDEMAHRRAGTGDRTGLPGGNAGEQSPLQARAAFIQNWNWQSVVGINRGTCERGRAQHGLNSETAGACESAWETQRQQSCSLGETIDFLLLCHRRAPFLFFNGNTFSAIGRQLVLALFGDVPTAQVTNRPK